MGLVGSVRLFLQRWLIAFAVLSFGACAALSADFNLPTYPVLLNHGSTGWLTVSLSQAPANGVSLTPSGARLGFHPATITFGPGETAKSVMVYDMGNAGPGPVPITYAVTGADAASYNVPPAGAIEVQGRIYATFLGNLARGATSDWKTILISPSPKSGLSITLSGAGLTFNPPTLVFNPGDQTQFVTITAASNAPLGLRPISYTLSGPDAPYYQQDGTLTTQIVAPPRLANASPNSGPIAGGTAVTITGSDLVGVGSVTFGGVSAMSFSVNSPTSISAVAPPHQPGTVDIVVTATNGSDRLIGGYTYVAPAPTLSNVSPNAGPPSGGTSVTITGTDLTGATTVTFGGTAAISFAVNGPNAITAVAPPHVSGVVDVRVVTPSGSATLFSGFTYAPAAPTVGGVAPNTGPVSGGSSVSISGINFTGATAVSFGGVSATSFTVNGANAITAVAPAHAPGPADVSVTTPAGTGTFSGGYTYVAPAPTLASVSPGAGPPSGGTSVTMTGTDLTGATAVTFGGTAAVSFTVNGPNAIMAVAPPHVSGAVDVRVVTPSGNATLFSGFTYLAPGPTLSAASPVAGPTAGGTSVTLTGTNLSRTTAVSFGGMSATSFVVNSATSITAVTPAHAAGAVDVVVVTPVGSAVLPGGYTYHSPNPGLWSVSPGTGPIDGGTSVTITIPGTNLSGATTVFFGGVPAISASVLSSTSISAIAPPHAAGMVDIVISMPGGPMTLAGSYVYVVPVPAIANISPTSGPVSGGTSVSITGAGLGGVTDVRFGGVSATSVTHHGPTAITAIAPPHAPGSVDVAVFSSAGGAIRPNAYTYSATSPTLTGVSPNAGTAAGGVGVTLTGTNFTGATGVSFGGVNVTSFTVNSATSITAVTPAHAAGAVDVAVTTAVGSAVLPASYTYNPTAPALASVSPNAGPVTGGTSVALTGTNLTSVTAVSFGGVNAASFTVNSPTSITAVTPAHAAGAVDVVVATPAGSAVLPAGYTYSQASPTLSSISPNAGPATGGTSVTLAGTNLTGAAAVSFGGVYAISFTVNSPTSITAITPAHAAGPADVMVATPAGAPVLKAAFRYQTVATETTITSSRNPSEFNQPVTFTASVTSGAGVPGGNVVFTSAGTPIGSASLATGRAQLTVSDLAVGNHAIKADYSGGGGFSPSSSPVLIQTVAKPADSVRLRQMQVLATRLAAQNSGAAITSAVDGAIAEAFGGGGQPLILGEAGVRIQSGERRSSGPAPDWLAWAEVKSLTMSSRRAVDQTGFTNPVVQPSMISGKQVNALMGLTYRYSPEFVAGIFAGYENLQYQSEVLNGRLRGDGWTNGAYLGWKLPSNLILTATGAHSQLSYSAQAGTAAGAFTGQRWLFSTGLSSRFNLSGFVVEPSAQAFGLWENQPGYMDTLGTRQSQFNFFTSRTAAGARISYPLSIINGITLAPYLGAYGDYYLNGTRGAAAPDQPGQAQDSAAILRGWSARLTWGVSGRLSGDGTFNLAAEYGGLGNPTRSWSLRGQLNVPFSSR